MCMLRILPFAILIYALLGTMTPDSIGVPEALVAACLVAAVPYTAWAGVISGKIDLSSIVYFVPALCFLAYGICVPLLIGIGQGAALNEMIRDVIPFLYLFLPLIYGVVPMSSRAGRRILIAFIALGVFFSVRYLLHDPLTPPLERAYLPNSPAVLFTCLFALYAGARVLYTDTKPHIIEAIGCAAVMALPLLAIGMTLQRISLVFVVFYALLCLACYFRDAPLRVSATIAALGTAILLLWPQILDALMPFVEKTALYGHNSRLEELQAVSDVLSESFISVLFGVGWGAHFDNPAVAGLEVSYTHSLLTATLLKTGVVGVFLLFVYLYTLMKPAVLRLWKRRQGLYVIALSLPLCVDLFLYASYKSLDFGILLLLIALSIPDKEET